jgi:hypothetical protein
MQPNQIVGFRYIDMAKKKGMHIYPFSLLQSVLLTISFPKKSITNHFINIWHLMQLHSLPIRAQLIHVLVYN